MSDFMHEDLIKTKMTYWQMLKRLWPYAKKHQVMLWTVIGCIIGLSFFSRLTPYLIGYAIDHGIKANNREIFVNIAFVYLSAEILKTLFHFSYAYFFQVFGNRVLFYLREDIMKHVQHLPMQYFNKTPTGRIVTRITNDVMSLGDLFTDGIINVVVQTVIMITIVVSMSLISWKLTIVTLFLAPIFIYTSFRLSKKIHFILTEQKKKLSTINSFLAENLNGIKVVQLYNRISKHQNKFHHLSDEYRALNIQSIKAYSFMQPVMNLFNACTITFALYYGGWLHLNESLAIGSLIAFLMHAQDFIPPLREILEKYQQFQNSITSAERIFTLLDEKVETQSSHTQSVTKFKGQLEIKNLNFKYEAHLPLVLKDICLSLSPGSSTALVGRTGSGKSTFISLLQRFYDCEPNTIFLDGIAIENITRDNLRKKIGVVQQDNFIFRGNIKENITLGDNSITDQQVQLACEQIGYDKLLKRTGRDIHSIVEERGSNLSVGERQLIAFARIVVFNPDILILDEATANIDSETEALIQNATFEITKNRTSILIAHRLSTIQKCDQIVVLRDGELKEKGSHHDLMKAEGYYYQLAVAGVKSTLITASAGGT